ncbi:MAG: hypothetical protein ACYCST_17810 [Acidimicrobiales bacterium]
MTTSKNKTLIAAAIAAAITTVALAGCASPQKPLLPARTPPPGLQAGFAQIETTAFASDATRPAWQGRTIVAEPSMAFQIAAPSALAAVAPTSGDVGVRWYAWYCAPVSGVYDLGAEIVGGNLQGLTRVGVFVDRRPGIFDYRGDCHGVTVGAGCDAAATIVAGKVAMAAGWHEIVVGATADATAAPRATVAISIRAPGAAIAVPLVPYWPVHATKAATK